MSSVELERACELWPMLWPQIEEPTVEDLRAAIESFLTQFPFPRM